MNQELNQQRERFSCGILHLSSIRSSLLSPLFTITSKDDVEGMLMTVHKVKTEWDWERGAR